MFNEGLVGVQNNPDSTRVAARMGKQGDQIASELHGSYYEQTYRGNVYSGSITGQVTTVGLATTYTGLCLSNPISSQVNLSIINVGVGFLVAFSAAATIGLMTGYNITTNVTHTAAVTPRNQKFVGVAGTGTGLLDSSATLPTAPTLNMILGAGLTGAITTQTAVYSSFDISGQLILTPGAYCAIYTSTASGAASGAFSFTWEEVPV